MKISTIRLITKVTATALWFCLCLVIFWNDPSRIFLFGIMFGAAIWHSADKADRRVSPKTNAVITGSLFLVMIILIVVFKLGNFPILNALIAVLFGAVMTYSKFLAQTESLKIEHAGDDAAKESF